MQFRGTLHFTGTGGSGWSETYYLQGTDHTDASVRLTNLLTARLRMLINSVHLVHAEVANVDHLRDSRTVGLSGPTENPGTYVPAAGTVPMPDQVAVLFELEGDPTRKNRKFLHGWTSADVDGNRYTPSAGMLAAEAAWVNVLDNGGFQVRDRSGPNPFPPPPLAYSYTQVSLVTAIRVLTRRTGRPFGLPVGRRRAG